MKKRISVKRKSGRLTKTACILLLALSLCGCGSAYADRQSSSDSAAGELNFDQKETDEGTETGTETGAETASGSIPPEIESCDELENVTPPEIFVPENAYTETQDTVYALTALNVRAQATTDSEILGVLSPGDSIARSGIGEEWMRVEYEGITAYVYAAYVSETKPTESAASGTRPDSSAVTAAGTGILYDNGGTLIAIDPGHQGKGNSDQEPVGPGASETKAKVSSGTQGVSTGIPEHELNLAVSLYLRDELLARGYSVLMIRETADVDISNAERAQLAGSYGAAAFVRVHANGASDQEAKGALTMCMTSGNPYNSDLYAASRSLSDEVLAALCAATGAVNKGVMETDTMSGINWCTIPVTIVEMGFMTNPEEDQTMATEDYRKAIARGIADGIDAYCENR